MKIKDFESKTGIKIEDLNENNFLEIVKNPEYKDFFSSNKNCLDLLDIILERNKDTLFLKEINTLKYSTQLIEDEKLISDTFKLYRENKITREKLLETTSSFRNSNDPIFVLSVFMCCMIALKDVNLKDEIEKVKDNIEKMKSIFESLGRIENSYTLRSDLIDLIYQVKTNIFTEYNISIDIKWVDDEIDKIDEFAAQFVANRELPEINIKPEQLGFIDITKLKKE